MRRACKVTLKFATAKKRERINALMQAYRAAVNFYIKELWGTKARLDKQSLALLPESNTRLSARYRSQALKQALDIMISTKKSAKVAGKPVSRPIFSGQAILDAKFVTIEDGKKSFDLIIKLSSLKKGSRIVIPTKKTSVLNKWMSKPGAKLINGCSLSEDSITIWVEIPDEEPKQGKALGIDLGLNKLIALSDGTFIGDKFRYYRDKILRKKKESKAKKRAYKERDNYIRQCVKKLPWSDIGILAIEDLKDVKKGKSKKRNKNFRKAIAPWIYSQVIGEIKNKAEENRVYLMQENPAYTSQTCPKCGTVHKCNRKGEKFKCVNCGYSQDADTVGAINILNKALREVGSVESPMLINSN